VAVAAVELSNQWYVPLEEDVVVVPASIKDGPSNVSAFAALTPSPQRLTMTNASAGLSARSLEARSLNREKFDSAEYGGGDRNDPESYHRRIDSNMLFILEVWRLSFSTIQIHQLCSYNIHEFTEAIDQLSDRVLDFINNFVVALEEGSSDQKERIVEAEADLHEIKAVVERLEPLQEQLNALYDRMDTQMVWTIEEAEARASLKAELERAEDLGA
jgi:hypothetical protein